MCLRAPDFTECSRDVVSTCPLAHTGVNHRESIMHYGSLLSPNDTRTINHPNQLKRRSRRQEAQRLGRILRAKKGQPKPGPNEYNANFYSLVIALSACVCVCVCVCVHVVKCGSIRACACVSTNSTGILTAPSPDSACMPGVAALALTRPPTSGATHTCSYIRTLVHAPTPGVSLSLTQPRCRRTLPRCTSRPSASSS